MKSIFTYIYTYIHTHMYIQKHTYMHAYTAGYSVTSGTLKPSHIERHRLGLLWLEDGSGTVYVSIHVHVRKCIITYLSVCIYA
jgi:hypothetical protein